MVESKNAARVVVLKGINDIAKFANRSYRTLLRLKQQYPGMPMTKDGEQGVWWADPDRLRQFLRDVAAGQGDKWMVAPEPEGDPDKAPAEEPEGAPDKAPADEPEGSGKKGDKGRG